MQSRVTKENNMLKIAFDPCYKHPLPQGHKFPMEKYELLPQQLIHEGTVSEQSFFEPAPIERQQAEAVHNADYLDRLLNLQITPREQRKTGFPHSRELIRRELKITGGSIQSARYAIEYGVSFNIAGGTHHAFTNRGEGFCLLNDIAVSSAYLLKHHENINRILVVDLDVHQGNGTAQIFANNPAVFTFSMHGEKNYPMHKEKSDLDIELPDYTDDRTYMKHLDSTLPKLLDTVQPDFIFYQCGVDVLKTDKLGRLGLTIEGSKNRDRYVLERCKRNGIPVACSMGGGYSERISDIIEAHANTYRLAAYLYF